MVKQKLIVVLAAVIIAVVSYSKHPVTLPSSVMVSGYTIAFGRATAAQAAPRAPVTVATDERSQWAIDLLAALGNNAPTPETVALVVAWQAGEGTEAMFNPLATTQDWSGATCFNSLPSMSCGVKNYQSRGDGLAATVETITNGRYPSILAGLQTNNPEMALNADELETWGTGLGNVERLYRNQSSVVRQRLVEYALSLQGLPYVYGGRSTTGADCSGTMQLVYKTVAGIDIGATTYSQQPNLREIDLKDVQPGDLWYGQYPDDQHTGMIADVDQDGTLDLINNGGLEQSLHVDYDFLANPYFSDHTIGFRTAL